MNKAVLYAGLGLGAAALGYLAYRYMLTPTQAYQNTSLNPNSNQAVGNFTTSPQQTYPFVANQPPRVDNSNQPWANNNRGAIAQVSGSSIDVNLSNAQMVAGFAKAASETAQGLKSIWDDLGVSDWFNNEDPSGFAPEVDLAEWGDTSWDAEQFSWNA